MAYIDTKYLGKCETCRNFRNGKCNTYCDHGEEYSPNLSKIPTADVVEVKHGEFYLIDECSNEGVYCSVCHKKVYKIYYGNIKVMSNYCPNCGAKMDGGKAE